MVLRTNFSFCGLIELFELKGRKSVIVTRAKMVVPVSIMDQHFRAFVRKTFTVHSVHKNVIHATKETINALKDRSVSFWLTDTNVIVLWDELVNIVKPVIEI